MAKKQFVHRFERHDINRQSAFLPVEALGNGHWPSGAPEGAAEVRNKDGELVGYRITTLMDLRRGMHIRMDILLTTIRGVQYAVYPGKNGTLTGDLSRFSEEDLKWATEESERIWKVAQTCPELMERLR